MITKKAALERFINERVMGDREMALTHDGQCTYNHAFNGGCEIGQYLPRELAANLEGTGTVIAVFEKVPEIKVLFEDPDSKFWSLLQLSHDQLALAAYGDFGDFECALKRCAESF